MPTSPAARAVPFPGGCGRWRCSWGGCGAAVFEGTQPALGVAADPGGHAVELAVQPGVEGGAPVVVQHARLTENLGDVPGGQVPGMQRGQCS